MDFALEALQLRGDVPCIGIAKAQKTQKPFFSMLCLTAVFPPSCKALAYAGELQADKNAVLKAVRA